MAATMGERGADGVIPKRRGIARRTLLGLVVALVVLNCASVVLWLRCAGIGWECTVGAGVVEVAWWGPESGQADSPGIAARLWLPGWEFSYFSFGQEWGSRRVVALPLWAPTILAAIPAAVLSYRARRRAGSCANCGYSLVGLGSTVCPECGHAESVAAQRRGLLRSPAALYRRHTALVLWLVVPILLASGACLAMQVWFWSITSYTTIVIPSGYRGEILIVKDAAAVEQPQRHGRSYTYVVPESGVVRARTLDMLDTYSGLRHVACREADGTVIPQWHGEAASQVSFYCDSGWAIGLSRMSVRKGTQHMNPLIPPEVWEGFFRAREVPRDYVAPRAH